MLALIFSGGNLPQTLKKNKSFVECSNRKGEFSSNEKTHSRAVSPLLDRISQSRDSMHETQLEFENKIKNA